MLHMVPMLFAAQATDRGRVQNMIRREEVVVVVRACRSLVVVLAILAGAVLFSVASPAWACGCGAYVPDNPGSSVADERALIAWDGAREDIVMSLSVMGSSDRAAWVMPVSYTHLTLPTNREV